MEDNGVQVRFLGDITKESKLKFFKVPRLGCYMAISLIHKTCLYEEALDKAFENHIEVQKKIAEQEKKKQERKEELEREKEEKEATGEVNKEAEPEPEPKWEDFKEDKYQTKEINYFICMDTLGQDREFTEKEQEFAKEIAKDLISYWDETDRKILTHDKEMRARNKKKIEELGEKEKADMIEELEKAVETELAEEAK